MTVWEKAQPVIDELADSDVQVFPITGTQRDQRNNAAKEFIAERGDFSVMTTNKIICAVVTRRRIRQFEANRTSN